MDTTREVMASGNEVESAAFHEPVTPTVYTLERGGLRGKLDGLKSRGLSALQSVQSSVTERRMAVKQSIANASTSLRNGAQLSVTRAQDSMRNSPMTWAGIAAGSGLALGMVGRILQMRRNRYSRMPQLVIIESTC